VNDREQDHGPIEEGAEYVLSSSKDKGSFLFRYKPDGLTAKLLGDDASRFRQDYQDIKARYPNWSADQVLAQLWDQGGYSWLAEQDS
jgi:hypothetical protein